MLALAGMSAPSTRRHDDGFTLGRPAGSGHRTNALFLSTAPDARRSAGDVGLPPLPWRAAVVSGERPVEGGVGFVVGPSCDLLGRFPGTRQKLAGQFHPELGQVRHRRLPESTG